MPGASERDEAGDVRREQLLEVRWCSAGSLTFDSDYGRVIELHRSNKATLGLLPYAAFEEAAATDHLMVGVIEGEVSGYVLFGTPRQQQLKLVHVCVDAAARGTGLAKTMIDAVIAANPGRTMMTAHCREDYDIDGFWRALDMAPVGQRPGRAAKGSILTIWARRIGQLDLFEAALYDSANPLAVLDTNVIIDLFASEAMPRPDRPESLGLGADWLVDVLELAISPEVTADVKQLDPGEREHVQQRLDGLVTLRRESGMRATAKELERLMPAELLVRDRSLQEDARHLADAILAGADYFVTRDVNLINATTDWIQPAYGIEVVRPVDLIRRFIPPSAPTTFRSGHLESVGLSWVALPADLHDVSERFVNSGRREKASHLKRALQAALAAPATAQVEVLVDDRDREWALLATEVDSEGLVVPVLRVARGYLGETISFQLVRYLRSLALARGLTSLTITDPMLGKGRLNEMDLPARRRRRCWPRIHRRQKSPTSLTQLTSLNTSARIGPRSCSTVRSQAGSCLFSLVTPVNFSDSTRRSSRSETNARSASPVSSCTSRLLQLGPGPHLLGCFGTSRRTRDRQSRRPFVPSSRSPGS